MNKMLFRPDNLTSGAVVAIMVMGVVSLAGQDFRAPRGPDAKPDLNGIWQALNEANYDIEAHVARSAMALRPAPYGPVPAAAVLALGAVGAVPPSLGVVEGGEIPYKPEALARRTQNQQDWLNLDPEIKCYLPGVPRATYMPYPFQILQSASADGRLPPYNEAARKRLAAARATPASTAAERASFGEPPGGAYDNPEQRPLSERCLLGFGSTSGPPALPDYFYNDLHQIVQTPDSVMILSEMIHDARIVRMNAQHLPKNMRRWMGDSVGHWDGDTLVIDTTNFNDKTRFRGSTENLHVIERLTRVDGKTLLYRFTIEDLDTWDQPWTGEYVWPATNMPMYEYACHEGNFALAGILRGARRQEAEEAAAQPRN
jgi:hypothetical protein